jgi:excisionase family DNA binding protein
LQATASYRKGVVATNTEELLSLSEAAERLGVSIYTVRRWIKDGKLRAFRPGKEYRVQEADLEEFLAAREVRPKEVTSPSQRSLFNGLEEERREALEILFDNLRIHITGAADRWIHAAETGLLFWSEDAAIAYSIEVNNEASHLYGFISEALEPALEKLFAGTLTLRSEQRKLIQAMEHLNKAVEMANRAADAVAPPKEPSEEDWAAFAEIAVKLWEEMDEVEQRRQLREVTEVLAAECEEAAEDLRGRIA